MVFRNSHNTLDLVEQHRRINIPRAHLAAIIRHIQIEREGVAILIIYGCSLVADHIRIEVVSRFDDHSLQVRRFQLYSAMFGIRYCQGSYTRHMRTSHRRSLHVTVLVVGKRTQNRSFAGRSRKVIITTRGRHIHPGTITGIVCRLIVDTHRSNRHNALVSSGEERCITLTVSLIAGREDHKATGHRSFLNRSILIHAGIVNEIIHRLFQRRENTVPITLRERRCITPTVLADYGTVVGSVLECTGNIVGRSTVVAIKHAQAHDTHTVVRTRTARYTTDADTVVVYGRNRSGNVRSVVIGAEITARAVAEVVAEIVVHITVAVIIDTGRTVHFGLVEPHVVIEVFVVIIHRTVDNRNDHVTRPLLTLPCRYRINIGAGNSLRDQASVVLIVPLQIEHRVIERIFDR